MNCLHPEENKFHLGNGGDGKHYWLTPPKSMQRWMLSFISTSIPVHIRCRKGLTV